MSKKKQLRNDMLAAMMESMEITGVLKKTRPSSKNLLKGQERFTITGLDIVTWLVASVLAVIPFFYALEETMYLWLFALALMGTMLVRGLAHRIASLLLVITYSLLTVFFNYYLNFTGIFELTFLINSVSLSWGLIGTLVGGAVAVHAFVSGCKAKPEEYRAGWTILIFVVALTAIDLIFARTFLGIADWNQLLLIGLTQVGIYTCALSLTWVLTYAVMRLFVMAGSAIMNMQAEES